MANIDFIDEGSSKSFPKTVIFNIRNKQLRKALYTTIELFLFTVHNYGNLGKNSF